MIKSKTTLSPVVLRLVIISFIVLFTAIYSYQKKQVYLSLTSIHGPVLKHLPEFSILDFYSQKQLASKKILKNSNGLLVHFWGTWCGPCAVEFPMMMKFSKDLSKHGITLLLVDVNDTKKKTKKFLRRFKKYMNKNVIFGFDPVGDLMPIFGTSKVPETFLFNKKGEHVKKFIGPQEWEKKRYLDQILKLLNN